MDGGLAVLASPTMGYGASHHRGAPKETISTRAMHCPPWNGTGFPALAVPMGFDPDGLPLSLQLIARPFEDAVALTVGHAYQQRTDRHLRKAPLHVTHGSLARRPPDPAGVASAGRAHRRPREEVSETRRARFDVESGSVARHRFRSPVVYRRARHVGADHHR
ncbi:MAG: amidase family protein [Acidimicrobiales bacterium]